MQTLTRREPRQDPIDLMFQRFFGNDTPNLGTLVEEGTLACDVSEDEKNVYVRASLPGFDKGDVDIDLHDGVLTIKAEHTEEEENESERFFRRERRIGSMSRRVALPGTIDEDNANAELKDGVLTVTVPKSKGESPRKLKIKQSRRAAAIGHPTRRARPEGRARFARE